MNQKLIKEYLKRIFLSIIIFFFLCLAIDNNFINQDVILKNSVDFSYIRSKTRILFGNFLNKKELYVELLDGME